MKFDASKGLFFCDGCLVSPDGLLLATGFNTDSDQENSRVVFKLDDGWRHFDVEDAAVISVAAHDGVGYVISSNGTAFEIPLSEGTTPIDVDNNTREWLIDSVSDYGDLTRVRVIDGTPYCCGQCGQVLRLGSTKWVRADYGLRSDDGPDLDDIDGSAADDLYVVGMAGAMCRFDGKKWSRVELPTNLDLSNIRHTPDGTFYICGDDAVVLKGCQDHWEIVGEPVSGKNYWGLEIYKNLVYLAHGEGIDQLIGDEIVPVPLSFEASVTFHRLAQGYGQLYSIGTDDIFKFDGTSWSRIQVPSRP